MIAATLLRLCRCGLSTHILIEASPRPGGDRLLSIVCAHCGRALHRLPGIQVWTARSSQALYELRRASIREKPLQHPHPEGDANA